MDTVDNARHVSLGRHPGVTWTLRGKCEGVSSLQTTKSGTSSVGHNKLRSIILHESQHRKISPALSMPLAKREQLKGIRHVALASTKPPISNNFTKQPPPDPSLVIGIGAGALYMLFSCHEEMKRLNRAVEQTELLLLELREKHEHLCEDSPSLSCIESRSMRSPEVRAASSQGLHASMDRKGHWPFATSNYSRDSRLGDHDSSPNGMAKDEMAILAAELEAELAVMEINVNAEDIILDELSIHEAGEVSYKGSLNSYHSDTSSQGIVEACNAERSSVGAELSQLANGASAVELDHQLREVLVAQQQERILELEKLLKETEAKLLAKDLEILGWKNHVNSLAKCFQHTSEQETNLESFPGRILRKEGNSVSTASCTVSHPLEGSLVRVSDNGHGQGTGVDMADLTIMETLDARAAPRRSRDHAVLKSQRMSDCSLSDQWSNGACGSCYEGDSLLVDTNGEDAASSSDVILSSSHHRITKAGETGTSPSPLDDVGGRTKKDFDKDSPVVKHMFTTAKSNKSLDKWSSSEEGMQSSLKTGLKLESGSPQGWRWSMLREGSVEMNSPVLDKVRHYEALVGRAQGKGT